MPQLDDSYLFAINPHPIFKSLPLSSPQAITNIFSISEDFPARAQLLLAELNSAGDYASAIGALSDIVREDLAETLKNLKNETLGIDDNAFNIAQGEESSESSESSMQNKKAPKQSASSESTAAFIDESRYAWVNKTVAEFLENHRLLLVELITVVTEMDRTIQWRL